MSTKIKYNKDGSRKKRWGDRPDAYLVRDIDNLHLFMPYLMPTRCANEAVLTEEIDLTNLNEFLAKKNANNPEFKYTYFHAVLAALAITIKHRPRMNRFYINNRLYERSFISFSFVAKRKIADDAHEGEIRVMYREDGNPNVFEQMHEAVYKKIYPLKHENKIDAAGDILDTIRKLPRCFYGVFFALLRFLNKHGLYPLSFMDADPDFASVFVTNLGSIKMKAQYHHLAEWGTNSFFMVISQKENKIFLNEDGSVATKEVLPISFTIDERIADGVYFMNSIKIFRKLLQNPELLEMPIDQEVVL